MTMRSPLGASFGSLDGELLIGQCLPDGDAAAIEWMFIRVELGRCVEVSIGVSADAVRGRFELTLPDDPRPDFVVDIRIVADAETLLGPGGAVAALVEKSLRISGDEAFFIRYTPEVLALAEHVFSGGEEGVPDGGAVE